MLYIYRGRFSEVSSLLSIIVLRCWLGKDMYGRKFELFFYLEEKGFRDIIGI